MEQQREIQDKRKRLRQILQIIGSVISMFLFFWLLREQDWQTIWKNLRELPVWLWVVCFALVVVGMICNALRWYVLLRAQEVEIPFGEVVCTVFAGAFASNFLPSTIGGDAFRVISLSRFTSDRVLSLTSVVVDRVMNVAATVTFLPFAWFTFGNQLFEIFGRAQFLPAAAGGFPLWDKLVQFIRRIAKRFIEAIAKWRRNPLALLAAFAISWISIFIVYLSLWLLARYLGMPITLMQLAGVEFIVYVATLLPVSLNGFGVREVIYTTLMIELGASPEHAAALTLISRFLLLLTTTPGAFWLSRIMSFQESE